MTIRYHDRILDDIDRVDQYDPLRIKMIKITNQKVLFFSLFATLLFNIVVLSEFNVLFVGSTYSFLYLIIIPGFFILRLLRIRRISFFESLVYSVGFSISYLFLVGISTNLLVLLPFIPQPLNMQNSLIVFNIYTIFLLLFNYIRENNSLIHITLPKVTFTELFFYIVPFFFPILSIFGAKLLNEYGINTLTMILLSSVMIYVILITIFMKSLEQFYFEIPIYLIAISFLFMFSLRSSYIIGWDVYTEYKVFLLTETSRLWSMANYPEPYNACLSITILPTLFHYFTNVDNQYVFKVLFQCIFALAPIIIYSLAKKFTSRLTVFLFANRLTAFLSAFFFMITLNFFREMPALDRQEIAFLFFGLLLLMLFNKQIAPLQKKLLFVILTCSIVLAHYSTTYILIVLLGFACTYLLIRKKIGYKSFHIMLENYTLKPLPVVVFITFAFVWFGVITGTFNNLLITIDETSTNITNFSQHSLNTTLFEQFFSPAVDPQALLVQQIKGSSKENGYNHFTKYPKSTYQNYFPTIIDKDISPSRVSVQISDSIYFIGDSITKVMKLLIILGFIGAIIYLRKSLFSAEYSILSIGFAIAIILFSSIPAISLFYPIGRLDQQTLFLIAFPAILSLSRLLRFIPFRIRMLFIATLFISYALFTNTFIPQLIGGQEPDVVLNNSGLYYDEIYLHPSEITSIHWLDINNKKDMPVFADIGSTEKMMGYSYHKYIVTYEDVFPQFIAKNGYVYSNYANTLYGIGIISLEDTRMEYNFPNEFLDSNKNLVYSNYYTKIYK
jgi:uncharacterized membrane protein